MAGDGLREEFERYWSSLFRFVGIHVVNGSALLPGNDRSKEI